MTPRNGLVAAALAAVLGLVVVFVVTGREPAPQRPAAARSAGPTAEPTAAPSGAATAPGGAGRYEDLRCPAPTLAASTAEELEEALVAARPGDVITLADGTYQGNFTATASGTPEAPIWLCGPGAVLDGGDVEDGYVLHLDGARHWNVVGLTVQNGQKGIMADGTVGSRLHRLTVRHIGDEAIHLRRFSTDSVVSASTVSDTGLRRAKFGEGVYIGTAESNWCDVTGCEPDRSDRNTIAGNHISGTTAEAIDVKEGTSDGVIAGNLLDGAAMVEADSWVDVKGNGWLVEGNTGTSSPMDGFQTHEILEGWGDRNVFRGNAAAVDGPGFGYSLTPALGNVVECSNTAERAAEGTTNVECASP
ncbi:hypothetical protein [Georgenia sp. AZ-5]|uniref:hypothetical protein n=1 Tax=Georgenia sp. AZ-5 TaxID=3367526 RepID=UPI003754105D